MLASVKRYGQRCPLARALDVVGDRWNLLVVRELMVGPRRYTDLLDGLPGIGTNILAARLRDLGEAGIVTRRSLPPPTAVTVYELTEAGRALGPSLTALRNWGAAYAPPPRGGDSMRPAWALMSAASVLRRSLEPGLVCEFQVGSEVFQLASDDGGITVRGGQVARPAAVVSLDTEMLYQLISGRATAQAVREQATIEGDAEVAAKFLTVLAGTVTATASAS